MLVRSARFVISLSLFFTATLVHLHGQTRSSFVGPLLVGNVRDPQSRPIPEATITIFPRVGGQPATVISDAAGEFRLSFAAVGEYFLRVEAPGFAPFVEGDLRLEANRTQKITITLAVAGGHEQINVTASGTPQSLEEVTKSISSVNTDEMQERGVQAIAPVVALAPGIRAQQAGGPGALTTIRIRGMRDQDTAVLIDGMQLRDPSAIQGNASAFLSDLMLVDTSRVEVLNGAGSSLYGTSAIGGVFNVLTDQGGGPLRASIAADGGSLGSMRGRANLSGSAWKDRLAYSVGFGHWNVLEGVDGDDAFRNTSVQGHALYRLTNSATLSARLFLADSFGKLNSDPVQMGHLPETGIVPAIPFQTFLPGPNNSDATRANRFLSGAMILNGQPQERLNYSVSFQTVASSRRYSDGPAGSGFQPLGNTRSSYDGRIQTVHARANYQLGGANLLSSGYEFEHENFASDYTDSSDPGSASALNATQQSQSVFVQDQVRLFGGRLLLSGAFRAQFFTLHLPSFKPAATAPYQRANFTAPPSAYTGDGSAAYVFRSTNTKVRAHLGRGYRVPSLYERFGASFDSFFGYSQYGDPGLQPERSVAFDSGIDQLLFGKRVTISATYFYTQLQQIIGFGLINGADPFGRFFGYKNLQGGLSRGVEVGAKASITRSLDLSAAYTFVHALEQTPQVDDVLRRFVIPRHQFSLFATQRVGQRWMFSFDTLQSGTYLAPILSTSFTQRVYEFDGVRRVNAGASYRLPLRESATMRVYVRGENLAGQDYYESGFRTPGRTALGGLQFDF